MVHYDKSKYADLGAAVTSLQWDAITDLVVMIEVGESNPAFDSVLSHISQIANYSSGNTSLGQGNLPSFPIRSFLPVDLSKFYRYNGSSPAPNCYEVVIWNVFKDPISISQAQLDMFRTVYGVNLNAQGNYKMVDNYRYIQPLNGRTIYYSSAVTISPMRALFIMALAISSAKIL
ncbi:carbonic anhydrase 14-like [Strongylocentrotus purpuratus]|uniref:Alpha-carbonic anhydrase domain-containing protein n=1 Tax=Strongylocentrotus purpuratus TaxID=7668 RepID=A0A7M7N3E2_STRPU|nr:carbonic anhydrase 14-like [Strongylocentrotus purpuratus]